MTVSCGLGHTCRRSSSRRGSSAAATLKIVGSAILEMPPPSSLNGPPLRRPQIRCTRQIETDTVQSSGLCIASDTAQSSGLRPCASLAAYNRFAFFLARKEGTTCLVQNPLPVLLNFCGRRYGPVTAVFPTFIWSNKKRIIRHVRGDLDHNITFSERTVPGALKGPGSEKVGRSVYTRLLPTSLALPSS